MVNLELKEVVPPAILYHGTAFKNLESIKKEGIIKMSRQHVHLSADKETAINVATRHSVKYIILEIDTEAMLKENISPIKEGLPIKLAINWWH